MEKLKTKEKHGMTKTQVYRAWADMKNRCYNKSLLNYFLYGGRGIRVCDEWFNSFTSFYNDIGYLHKDGLIIDRIDNEKGYYPSNCRWVSPAISSCNQRNIGIFKKGVSLNRTKNKFISKIQVDGKSYYIGSFKDEISAHNSYLLVRKEWYGF